MVIYNRSDMSRLKKSQIIFNNLCLATIELNHIFSLPALLIISSKLVSILYSLFSIIDGVIKPNVFNEKAFLMNPFTFLVDSIVIYVYLTSADSPIHHVILNLSKYIIHLVIENSVNSLAYFGRNLLPCRTQECNPT